MTVSTQAAPRQMSLGRFPSVLAIIALAVVIVAAIALIVANAPKAAAPAASTGFGHGPGDWYYATTTNADIYGVSKASVLYNDHGASGINEMGVSKAGVLYNDHGASGINESRIPATESFKGPYLNNGVIAVPPAAASTGKTFNGLMPYAGPFYYEGLVPHTPYATGATIPGSGGALGYPPNGATYSTKTIESPYVAPRPRNQ